jgi:hypothetical protein
MLPLYRVELSSGLLRCSFKNPILNVNFQACQIHVAIHCAGDDVSMTLTNAVHCHHYQCFAILGRHPLRSGVSTPTQPPRCYFSKHRLLFSQTPNVLITFLPWLRYLANRFQCRMLTASYDTSKLTSVVFIHKRGDGAWVRRKHEAKNNAFLLTSFLIMLIIVFDDFALAGLQVPTCSTFISLTISQALHAALQDLYVQWWWEKSYVCRMCSVKFSNNLGPDIADVF